MKPAWLNRLAAELLREYSERLSDDECNDYGVPDYVNVGELKEMVNRYHNEPEDVDSLTGYNWAVVDAVAHALETP